MYEFTCPKCQATAPVSNVPSGSVVRCTVCGQRLRVMLEDGGSPRSSAAPLLVGFCGLSGFAAAGVLMLLWFILSGETSGGSTDRKVAQNDTKQEIKATGRPGDGGPKDTQKTEKDTGKELPKDTKKTEPDRPKEEPAESGTIFSGEQIYKKLLKSSVWIVNVQPGSVGTGSGSVVDRDERLVLTNEHVANEKATRVLVMFPAYTAEGKLITEGKYYEQRITELGIPAEVVKSEVKRDLTLLRLARLPDDAAALRLAGRSVSPGQVLHTIGGLPQGAQGMWTYCPGTVRQVSFMEWQYKDKLPRGADVIESTMPINPGNSGGPVVDNRVRLVGVNALGSGGQLNTGHIDLREVRDFIQTYFRSIGKQWTPPDDAPGDPADDATIKKLIADLKHPNAPIRQEAARKLAQLGPAARPAVPELLKLLRTPDEPEDVVKAVDQALGEIGPPAKDQVQILIDALGDAKSLRARMYAADSLGKLGNAAFPVPQSLVQVLDDPDAGVRRSAATALGRLGPLARPDSFPALVRVVKEDKERDVRVAAGHALLALGKPADTEAPMLKELLANRTLPREGRVYAVWGLGNLGDEHAPAVSDAVGNDPDNGVVRVGLDMLAGMKVKSKDVGEALAKAVGHRELDIRMTAAKTLGSLGLDNTTLPGMVKAFASKDDTVRDAVLKGLPPIGTLVANSPRFTVSKEAVNDLKAPLASPEPLARAFAAYVLGMLGADGADAVPELRQALTKEKDYQAQREIIAALGEIGPAAKPALDELKEFLKETDDKKIVLVRLAAVAAVRIDARESGKEAYPILAKAMEVENLANRDSAERILHERAKKVLAQGGRPASDALLKQYKSTFTGRAPSKVFARKTSLEVMAKIGKDAKLGTTSRNDPLFQMLDQITKPFNMFGTMTDHEDVIRAANEAALAIYSK